MSKIILQGVKNTNKFENKIDRYAYLFYCLFINIK